MNRDVFGSFTPLESDPPLYSAQCAIGETLNNFLFTRPNPHNVPGWRFALKANKAGRAILYYASWGSRFFDIGVHNDYNANADSIHFRFGNVFTNDMEVGADQRHSTLFTGSLCFKVKQIDVFEIITRLRVPNVLSS